MRKYKVFTLAEVLITLVIIGIIAAITVPVLVTNYQKKQTCIKLKKFYSELSQAVMLAETQYGGKENWEWGDLTSYEFFNKYLYPFIKLDKNNMSDIKAEGIKFYDASGKIASDTEFGLTNFRGSAKVTTLASGAQILSTNIFAHSKEQYKTSSKYGILIDLNGVYNKPNRMGRDLFEFVITPDGVWGHRYDDKENYKVNRNREQLKNGPSKYNYQCNKNSFGLWCAALVMADNWEIKDDYPW